MDSLLHHWALQPLKPLLGAMALPPVPFILVLLLAFFLAPRRWLMSWLLALSALAGLWLSHCEGYAQWLEQTLLDIPAAMDSKAIAAIKQTAKAGTGTHIVVLGAGVEPLAPEYGVSNLSARSTERLRYGVWLARQTGLPLGFSGGVGWAGNPDLQAEALVAGRIAAQEFNLPLRWTESESRDTRENAMRTVALLRALPVKRLIVVTHGWHMQRALRDFRVASADQIEIVPAPMGLSKSSSLGHLQWLPSSEGYSLTRFVWREWLGRIAGA